MRHEMIISYRIEDGQKTGMRNEGELIRCDDCIKSRKSIMGMWCGCKRTSPIGYCDRGRRKDE